MKYVFVTGIIIAMIAAATTIAANFVWGFDVAAKVALIGFAVVWFGFGCTMVYAILHDEI